MGVDADHLDLGELATGMLLSSLDEIGIADGELYLRRQGLVSRAVLKPLQWQLLSVVLARYARSRTRRKPGRTVLALDDETELIIGRFPDTVRGPLYRLALKHPRARRETSIWLTGGEAQVLHQACTYFAVNRPNISNKETIQ